MPHRRLPEALSALLGRPAHALAAGDYRRLTQCMHCPIDLHASNARIDPSIVLVAQESTTRSPRCVTGSWWYGAPERAARASRRPLCVGYQRVGWSSSLQATSIPSPWVRACRRSRVRPSCDVGFHTSCSGSNTKVSTIIFSSPQTLLSAKARARDSVARDSVTHLPRAPPH